MMRSLLAAACIATALTIPAQAASGDPPLLALQSKAVMSGRALPVIVEFRTAAPTGPQASGVNPDKVRTAVIRDSQSAIMARAFGVTPLATRSGSGPAKLMDHVPMLAVTADAAALARLASDPLVVRIVEDRINRPVLLDVLKIQGVSGASGSAKLGATGRGRAVAILDTGVDKKHEFLKNKVISEACYGTNIRGYSTSQCPNRKRATVATNSALDCPSSVAGCGHGTHVAGIAAGKNTRPSKGEPRTGVAANAGIVAIKVFSKIKDPVYGPFAGAFDSDVLKALERVYALRGGVNGRVIDSVNLSLGGSSSFGYCNSDIRSPIITLLRDAGIATVIAAGNDGRRNAVSFPACIEKAVTVGASTKKRKGKRERVASYSNMGLAVDILATGGDIRYPFSSNRSSVLSSVPGTYEYMPGTSMAAPVVAGAFAAIRSRPACRTKTVDEIETAMTTTGPLIRDRRTGGVEERRRLNVKSALKKLGCT